MDFKIEKVAMTGGTGPVGMALIERLLEEKIEILLFQREDSERKCHLPKDDRLHIVYCSLGQLNEYVPQEQDYDVFFHLGWTNTFQTLRESMEAQYENVRYSCDAVELACKLGCHSFVGAGSQAEYGRHDGPLRGDTVCKPENAYGVMKLCACHATRILCQRSGIRHIWPRILSGYGKYDNKYSMLISNILNALEGQKLQFSKGDQIWDFLYMGDVADALLHIARRGKNGAVYPIGSGKARPLSEYIRILCEKLGKLDEMELGGIPYSDRQIMHLEADISELQKDTGWVPKVEFEDGIERAIHFYRTLKSNEEKPLGGGKIMREDKVQEEVMVSVLIVAYNHEKVIKDAIEGALNQKTDFKIELLIHDDASTDNTPGIIRAYEEEFPEIIRPIYEKENQFRQGKLRDALFSQPIRGKYFALCDGDDYWTDMDKLQRQVAFMEAHEEYSMCLHNAVQLNCMTGERTLLDTFPGDGTYSQEDQILAGLGTNFPACASYLFRTKLLKEMPRFFYEISAGDYPLRQYYANRGPIYYFKEPMSVYRVAISNTYMSNIRESQAFYNSYTLETIAFLEKFDEYTDGRFHSILERKIFSDYLGFCASIDEADGMRKIADKGLDIEKTKECYKCLSLNYLSDCAGEFFEQAKHIFIYGTSRIASVCKRQLEHIGVEFEGFVVSNGQMKSGLFQDKRVYSLSEVLAEYEDPGFILAVQPVNADEIERILKKNGVKKYCKPYVLGETRR